MYLPFVDEFRINLERPNEASEHLDGPRVAEHVFDIRDIHTKLIAEALLDIERDFSQNSMDFGNSLVSHSNLGQIRVLEEAIVWLVFLDSESDSSVNVSLIAACLGHDLLSTRQKVNMAAVLEFDSALNILRASNILDLYARTLILFTLN